jgi:hypothetical protein
LEHAPSIFRVEKYAKKESSVKQAIRYEEAGYLLLPSFSCSIFSGLYDVVSQKIEFFITTGVTT